MVEKLRCPVGLEARWDEHPPPAKVRRLERYVVTPGREHQLVIVSSRIVSVRTHYVDGRTQKCTGEQGQCWLDHAKHGNSRWCGWLAVCRPGTGFVELVSLTKIAADSEPRLRDPREDLRGLTLKLRRKGGLMTGEMSAGIDSEKDRVANLPPAPDLKFCINRMLEAPDKDPREGASLLRSHIKNRLL